MARGSGTVSNQSGIEEGKPYQNGFGDACPTSCPCFAFALVGFGAASRCARGQHPGFGKYCFGCVTEVLGEGIALFFPFLLSEFSMNSLEG